MSSYAQLFSATPIVRSAPARARIGNWPDPMKGSIGNWPDPMTASIGWWPNTMKARIGNWPDPMNPMVRAGSAAGR
ncbi:hypothetical protein [Arthrobacter sp. Y81]|uniref:hypothetical protein n=1 Tax=Arthrobacter sp. Y81 TaxID=2058897 RepID=UPI000CE43786|nr:hypothetical protein [Arthrobacter sp. Y81]